MTGLMQYVSRTLIISLSAAVVFLCFMPYRMRVLKAMNLRSGWQREIGLILIEAVEEKSDAIFQRNAALWEKLDEICNALPDDYDFTNFDEAAFIRSTNALTETEKETLLADIKELNELDAQMEALYAQLPDCDNMPLYEKALEKADPKVLDEIDTLEQEYDRVCEKHADLWDKVDEAYFDLPDDYDFDNYDEAAFIRSLSFLTDAEKDALIADYKCLTEIDSRLCELYNSIWSNTGCESGICPL